jgi:hypothetical protein
VDLQVIRAIAGDETVLALNVDYTVAGDGNPAGGTVTLAVAPAAGATIVILRRTVRTQDTLYVPNDPFPAQSHEAALDKLTMIAQEDADELTRALLVPEADSARGQMILPAVPDRAGKYLGFDANGLPVALSAGGGGSGGGSGGGGGPVDSDDVAYQGQQLTAVLQNTISQLGLTQAELALQGLKNIDQDQTLAEANGSLTTLGEAVQDLDSRYNTVIAAIDALGDLGGDVGGLITLITDETLARQAGDQAMVDTVELIGAKSDDSTAFILDLDTVHVSPTTSLSQRLTFLDSEIGDLSARIADEHEAWVAGDAAETAARTLQVSAIGDALATAQSDITTLANANILAVQNFTLLGARNDAGTAWNLNLGSVMVADGESLGTRLAGIATSLGANSAAVADEATARATADSALATSIGTVSTTVGDLTAAVTTLSSSIGGVTAKWGVALDVNGYVSGISQNNDGGSADFIVRADKFAVVTPGNPTFPVFEVTASYVRIAGRLIVDNLLAGTLNADMTMGSGRLIFDNGAVMKVQGIGFGTANQFIEWFGPKMAINLCSEANATYYLKTNGDAYFGGALSSGVLKNEATSTTVSATAYVVVGPFSSNGDTVNINVSGTFRRFQTANSGTGGISGSGGGTIALEWSNNDGASWNLLTTIGVSETLRSVLVDGEPGVPDQIDWRMAGSGTYPWNPGAVSGLLLRASWTARTLPTLTGSGLSAPDQTQTTTIIAIET